MHARPLWVKNYRTALPFGDSRKALKMDRLSILLTLIVGSVVTGSLVTLVLTLGWYSWVAIGGAAALGAALTWPASYVVSRRIKRQDPSWDETKVDRVDGMKPDPSAPEV